jgi:hypothetical protein
MNERTELAGMAMEGILIGAFSERPHARPTPEKIAAQAVAHADALRDALKKTPDPCETPPPPKVLAI